MSDIKVNSIKGVGASAAAITVNNTDGTCTANITSNGGGQLSNRNVIINGGMTVSQRSGTTQTTVTHDQTTYSVDRFAIFDKIDGGNNFTYQQTTAPVPDGFSHALKINTAIADTSIGADNYAFFYQVIEGQNIQQANLGTSAAKQLTLSFHVYSNKTGTYTVGLVNYGGYNRTFLKEFTISSSGTWEKKTITFPAITDGTWDNVRLQWCLVGGADVQGAADTLLTSTKLATSNQVNFASTVNNSFHITGVQLEVGSVATDFEHRSFGQELALCQRYFYRLAEGASKCVGLGVNYTSSQMFCAVYFPVTMRATPTLSSASGNTYYEFIREGGADFGKSSDVGNGRATRGGERFSATEISGTVGHGGFVRTDNSSVFVDFVAEL